MRIGYLSQCIKNETMGRSTPGIMILTKPIKLILLSITSSWLIACGSDNYANQVTIVEENGVIEIEQFATLSPSQNFTWQPVVISSDDVEALQVRPTTQPMAENSTLAVLNYHLDFTTAGEYEIKILGRIDGADNTGEVHITFGEDDGNAIQTFSGLDNQWQWYNTDTNGEWLTIEVSTPGQHLLSVSSSANGLQLDRIELKRLQDNALIQEDVSNTVSEIPEVNSSTDATTIIDSNTNDVHDSLTATEIQINSAPLISISAATSIEAGQMLSMEAIATDDGMPNTSLYFFWSTTSGPADAIFSSQQQAITEVQFPTAGTYTVQATANDGELYNNAYATVTVTSPAVAPSPQQPEDDHFNPASRWNNVQSNGEVTARHEAGGVVVDGKLYVMGGRGKRPVEVFDPANNSWRKLADAPLEMHHFQPVAIGKKIYVIGAFTCCYPLETTIDTVYIFDTSNNQWSKGPKLPANRKRGGAGAAVYNGKIYLLGGNTRGHSGGAVNWFDEFDPATGQWKTLPGAPDARDHVTIGIANGKLVAAGGRKTVHPLPFENTVGRTNVYDFATGSWSKAANIPTERAGAMAVTHGSEVFIIGGESAAIEDAHSNVEAFNVDSSLWRKLTSMSTGRHGGIAAFIDGVLHVVSGSKKRAAGGETRSHEILR